MNTKGIAELPEIDKHVYRNLYFRIFLSFLSCFNKRKINFGSHENFNETTQFMGNFEIISGVTVFYIYLFIYLFYILCSGENTDK